MLYRTACLVIVLLILIGCHEKLPDFKVGDHVEHVQTHKTGIIVRPDDWPSNHLVDVSWDETGTVSTTYTALLKKQAENESN